MTDVKINEHVFSAPSSTQKIHDLTMLYLKSQNLNNVSVSELAKKYSDTRNQFEKEFEKIHKETNIYV